MIRTSLIYSATLAQFIMLLATSLSANEKSGGLITQLKGQVQIFKNPGPKPSGDGMHILYEGLYYLAIPAQVGVRISEGSVIHTTGNASARVVYSNGDQINVGPSSSVKIQAQNPKTQSSELQLIYGKLRAVVNRAENSKAPRNFRVVTPSATAGVRGTDFAVAYDSASAKADISVLRGQVVVQPEGSQETHPLETGMTAKVARPVQPTDNDLQSKVEGQAPVQVSPNAQANLPTDQLAEKQAKPLASSLVVEIKKITQEALGEIQKFSYTKPQEKDVAKLAPEVAKEVQATEALATEKTLQSIKIEAPELFQKLEKEKIQNTNEINSMVVGKLMQEAPREPTSQKRLQEELKELDEDIYNKYFRKE